MAERSQFARLQPLLPSDTRGVARVDDRRVISGIIHVLKSGCRWCDAPTEYGPRKTLHNRFVRWSAKGIWRQIFVALADPGGPKPGADRLIDCPRSPLGLRRQRGEAHQAIGRSRGGRTTKIHAITDRWRRPIRLLLTGGQVPDCVAARPLLSLMLEGVNVIQADKGYDSDAIRAQIQGLGAAPNISPKVNRRTKPGFFKALYADRNAVKRMFGRLKDFRRIATRCDRRADVFLSAICLAATDTYWL